ncbi:MAG TPA: DUF4272 domain-containing protein [Cyclobacteriaceae bacterium]
MTALERKQNTEKLLETLGIRLRDELPPMEEEDNVELKTPREIAQRILVLTYLNCVATNSDLREAAIFFLRQENLWEHVSGEEKQLFDKAELTDEEIATIQWRGESIWMLLWIINHVDHLDLPLTEVNTPDIIERLPGFMQSTGDFINSATIRSVSEILDQSDLMLRLNWALRQAQLDGSDIALNPGVAYERYNAINWVTSLRPQWDDI